MEKLSIDKLRSLAEAKLSSAGLDQEAARAVVDEILEAEARGRRSHGVRLLPEQVKRVTDAQGEFAIVRDRGAVIVADGGDQIGPVVALRGMKLAIDRAREFGIGLVGVRNKFTFVMAGYHPRWVAREGFIGVAMSVAPPRVAPYGGSEPILGTNPIGIGVPGDPPFVLDFAMTKIPAADVRLARKEGTEIPPGCAVDAEGKLTTDPVAAIGGAMMTFGGHKGSGLAMVVELLSGALLDVKAGRSETQRRGMLFMTVSPEFFGNPAHLRERFQSLFEEVRASRPMEGNDQVMIPGDRSNFESSRVVSDGVEVPNEVLEVLRSP